MDKPRSKYEIHTRIILDELWITVETPDMAQRVEDEAPDVGRITAKQGESYTWVVNQLTGREKTSIHSSYCISVRPTFDLLEAARWLGRSGEIEFNDERDNILPESQEIE